jgi:hypothetical protein
MTLEGHHHLNLLANDVATLVGKKEDLVLQ